MTSLWIAIAIWTMVCLLFPSMTLAQMWDIHKYENRLNFLKVKDPLMYRVLVKEGKLCRKRQRKSMKEDMPTLWAIAYVYMLKGLWAVPTLWLLVYMVRVALK